MGNNEDYQEGSIVEINGVDLDRSKWTRRRDAPSFLGVIENPFHFDDEEARNLAEDEVLKSRNLYP